MLSTKVDGLAGVHRSRIGELYLRNADAAVRLAYLLTGDREVAEDLVQDAFIRSAGRLVHLRDPETFDAYLRTTIVNLSRSYFRRRRVERLYLQRTRAAGQESSAGTGNSIEDEDEMWNALRVLSQRQRAAIVLRFYEDLPEVEVAEILQCAPGTVKSLVSRGLERLRNEIGGEDR